MKQEYITDLEKNTIVSTILSVKTFALLLFIGLLGGACITLVFVVKINSIPLAIAGFFVFIIGPIVFIKQLRRRFQKKIIFTFENDFVLVEILNYQTERMEKQYQFNYSDVESCILNATYKGTSTIRIFLLGSKKLQYSFINENKITKDIDRNVGFEILKKMSFFNKNIELLPPFYASKGGKFALIILTALLITTIIVNVVFHSRSLPLTLFMGVALYFQILMRRKKDIEIFKNFKKSI